MPSNSRKNLPSSDLPSYSSIRLPIIKPNASINSSSRLPHGSLGDSTSPRSQSLLDTRNDLELLNKINEMNFSLAKPQQAAMDSQTRQKANDKFAYIKNRRRQQRKEKTAKKHHNSDGKSCEWCKAEKTPEWRTGPEDTVLCNACGLQYKNYVKALTQQKKNQERISINNLIHKNPDNSEVLNINHNELSNQQHHSSLQQRLSEQANQNYGVSITNSYSQLFSSFRSNLPLSIVQQIDQSCEVLTFVSPIGFTLRPVSSFITDAESLGQNEMAPSSGNASNPIEPSKP